MSHTGHFHLPHFHKHGHNGQAQNAAHNTNKIAIAGVTGKLGRLVMKHLLQYDQIEVHGIARNPDKLGDAFKSNPRVKLFKTDMTDVTPLREAVRGCSILISVVLTDPASELAMQKAMIDACVAEHVPRFMPNEFTIDCRHIDLELLPSKKVNKQILEYIEAQNGKVKGVHILIGAFMETVFSGGFLFDPRKSPAEGLSTWGDGNDNWELTSYDNAAAWAAAVALDQEATGYLKFLGDRLSAKEIAETLQEVYQLPSLPFTSKGSLADLKEEIKRGQKEHPNSRNFWDWLGKSYSLFIMNGEAYLPTPLNNQRYITELQQETLEEWLRGKKLEDLSKTALF